MKRRQQEDDDEEDRHGHNTGPHAGLFDMLHNMLLSWHHAHAEDGAAGASVPWKPSVHADPRAYVVHVVGNPRKRMVRQAGGPDHMSETDELLATILERLQGMQPRAPPPAQKKDSVAANNLEVGKVFMQTVQDFTWAGYDGYENGNGDDPDDIRNQAPEEFKCPITLLIMRVPVVASDGFTYESSALTDWFRTNQISPQTRAPLLPVAYRNLALQKLIVRWVVNSAGGGVRYTDGKYEANGHYSRPQKGGNK